MASREFCNSRRDLSPARLLLDGFPNESDIAALTAAITSGNG
jgi:hypothetical protein